MSVLEHFSLVTQTGTGTQTLTLTLEDSRELRTGQHQTMTENFHGTVTDHKLTDPLG